MYARQELTSVPILSLLILADRAAFTSSQAAASFSCSSSTNPNLAPKPNDRNCMIQSYILKGAYQSEIELKKTLSGKDKIFFYFYKIKFC